MTDPRGRPLGYLPDNEQTHKMEGDLQTQDSPKTAHGHSQVALNRAFPTVEHRQIVEYQGKRYRCRYFPEQKTRSGWAVSKWGKRWELVD